MCDTAATATYTHKVPDATVGVTQAVARAENCMRALTNEEAGKVYTPDCFDSVTYHFCL